MQCVLAIALAAASAVGLPIVTASPSVAPPSAGPSVGVNPLLAGFVDLPWDYAADGVALPLLSGSVPAWLSGTLYHTGPGRFPNQTTPVHWFDGLAFLQAYHLRGGQVTFDASFVGTTGYNATKPKNEDEEGEEEEENYQPTREDGDFARKMEASVYEELRQERPAPSAASDVAYQSISSLDFPFPYSPNSAVTIQEMNGTLLTSTAISICNQFDPTTTANVANPYDWPDALGFMITPAHRRRAQDGTFYHFGYYLFAPYGYLLYTIAPNTTERVPLSLVPIVNHVNYQHTFSLTENYIVLVDQAVQLPHTFDWAAFKLTPGVPNYYRVLSKATGQEVARFQSKGFFTIHHIHAYEDPHARTIELDVIAYPDTEIIDKFFLAQILFNTSSTMATIAKGRPLRLTLPLAQPNATVSPRVLADIPMDLPVVNPLVGDGPYQFVWTIGSQNVSSVFWDSLVKLDVATGQAIYWSNDECFPSEPLFVPTSDQERTRRQRQKETEAKEEWTEKVIRQQQDGVEERLVYQPPSPSAGLAARAEDDGVLLAPITCGGVGPLGNTTFLLLLDAGDMSELARVAVPRTIPLGFHGLWTDEEGREPIYPPTKMRKN